MRRKNKTVPLSEVLNQALKDPELKFYFDRSKAAGQIARLVKIARQKACLTQIQLARRVGISQSVIARLESGNDTRIPSLDLLQRIASALKARLNIAFEYAKAA